MILRYPGGKSRGPLSNFICELLIERYGGGLFSEPFFGGGGITFKLLKKGVIKKLVINEFDPPLADLWTRVIQKPGLLKKRVRNFKPSVDKFLRRKERLLNDSGDGFDFLVVNRLSHAGRGVMAGPQGGMNQTGRYKIGCRWNADTLCKNIDTCHSLLKSVDLVGNRCHNNNYEEHLYETDLVYLDPPYYEVGDGLYRFSFTPEQHRQLKNHCDRLGWFVLSYNNSPEVLKLYKSYKPMVWSVAGNGGQKVNSELVYASEI